VFVLREGQPRPVRVKPGVTDGSYTEVEGELREGDQVITATVAGAQSAQGASSGRRPAAGGTRAGGGFRPPGPFQVGGRRDMGVQREQMPLIALRGVSKIYQTGDVEVAALRGVDFNVETGEFVAIMGSSGSGKSTLMNILGRLDRRTAGEYFLDGQDVSRLDRNGLAIVRNRTLGFVFQSFNLLARTSALENVELPMRYAGVPARERKRRAREALERVGLGARLDHHPRQLSGGQQQRVAIARALVSQPRVMPRCSSSRHAPTPPPARRSSTRPWAWRAPPTMPSRRWG